jgi:hypothetical protein
MSAIRDLIVVSASMLAFSAVADADELRPIRAQGIDLAVAAAPSVKVHHGPRVRVPSLGGKPTLDIPIWRTAILGTYKTIAALRDALHANRIDVGDTADEILGRPAFNLSKMTRGARLVVLAVSELGFEEEGASLADIYARARQLGLELCPAEVGPELRLQYLNQPLGEFLHIAMAPIAGYGGPSRVGRRFVASGGGRSAGLGKGIAEGDKPREPDAGSGSKPGPASGWLLEVLGGEFCAASLCCGGGISAIAAGRARGEPGGAATAAESGAAASRGGGGSSRSARGASL